ncbi:hypothetical protein [Nocardia sp. CNY236]|uniref:hypothetical protein n=1 Tax=Nocardia sp. CNY236 TaxID=1169152 RepID=UPI0012DE8EC9|nr:hypothetical protein [Nocardia sp. CNY236]
MEVRALRRDALRISQRRLAEITGFSEAAVGKWERRRETITLTGEFAAGMDTVLRRLDDEQLARFQAQLADLVPRLAPGLRSESRPIISAEDTGDLPDPDTAMKEGEDEVNRNQFLRGLLAASVAIVDNGLDPVGSAPIEPPVPRRAGMDHVAQIRSWAGLFRAADDAGLRIGEGMASQLRTAVGYLEADMPSRVRTAMLSAIGTFFRVVGWAYYDRGQHGPARAHFQAGLRMADEAGEWWLRSAILTCMARQAIFLGNADDALTMLGVASVRSDRISLLRRADIAAVQVRAFGRLGNDVECIRSVQEAEQYFSEAADQNHPDTEYEGFSAYYNAQLLNSDTAHGLFDLAYERNTGVSNTIDRLRLALQLSDEHARSRQLCLTQLAALQLRHGDPDEGLALGAKAIESASSTSSIRVLDHFKKMYRATGEDRIKNATGMLELRRGIADLLGDA